MQLSETEARRRLTDARVVHLATADAAGVPHLVPATFALHADTVVIAVDAKPKRHQRLKRLDNLAANPRACVLADRYDDDWTQLWWVRADGVARILTGPDETREPIDRLAAKYPQYRSQRPAGPVIALRVTRWIGWAYR
ncbi:TIGR03668 family PPOX class F420-dependent oxidoreductase [Cryptosporangium aurantiacum]|uniref:PPOX class probable F420-dependent enzyme, Rv0121 family n=1 Tax=Cryptosporangium aurantiacum TaxID=134849 RepID=A0A1M7TVI6_9ACTN|nr:TIGR03668 family PPOX class F420-dependent oxidoreductase [Cryptosporangium aurantiacum]SHN74737.1 PPOX class probable F420-dependent enzyme, Rv0121 family [Cryptosporangium aurantiacum]